MAERRNKRDVCLEYTFDRLLVAKLEQVYRTLVPDRVRVVGEHAPAQAGGSKLIGAGDEDGGDLRPVSSDKQKEENTIASQTAALTAFAAEQGYAVPTEWIFEDEGYSGASLIRPGLERVRDLAAEGELDAVLVYAPDRLSRRYAYQILLIEELARAGVETLFIRS